MTFTGDNRRPLVSVLMVALKPHPHYFREAVKSILAQTLQDWELIIVEDPSQRCGSDVVNDFHDPRIRYFLNPQRTSLVAQRNRSLAEAHAEFVAIFDSDDICEPDRLRIQVEYLKTHPDIGVVGSQVGLISSEGRRLGTHSYPCTHDQIIRSLTVTVPMFLGSTMYRKAILHSIGGFRLDMNDAAEDYDLASRLALSGVRFANLPQTLVHYRFHPEQAKATRMRDIIRETFLVKKRYWTDRMSLGDKLRMYAELGLLWLPAPLVHRLVLSLRYGILSWAKPQFGSPVSVSGHDTNSLGSDIPVESMQGEPHVDNMASGSLIARTQAASGEALQRDLFV